MQDFVLQQVRHWLSTPQNAYLGSNYGIDLKQYLHRPISEFDADAIIAKMRQDIPALAFVEEVNILAHQNGDDGMEWVVQVGEQVLALFK